MIDVNPMVGVGIDLIENELQNLIEDLQTNLVNKKELDRIKAQVLATEIYQRDSIDYQARILGMIKTSVGSIKVIDEYTSNINAITAQQVREVAKKYLVENLKTTVTVNNVTKQ
jgi:zinc protease